MPVAISHNSTLCLNPSNHPSIPAGGLTLEAGKETSVTPEQGEYLKTIGIEVKKDAPVSKPKE